MKLSRRQFLSGATAAGGLWAMPTSLASDPARALPMCSSRGLLGLGTIATLPRPSMLNPATLARFVDALPIPPLLSASGWHPDPADAARLLPRYRIVMHEFESRLHRDIPPTRQWGYAGSAPGPTIETRSGDGLWIEWLNQLPQRHLLPVDHGIHGAGPEVPEVRAVPHVHGARVPPESDGYPERWLAPGATTLLHYPNRQDAATLWYHDHAMGITRLNFYAGLIGFYLVRDAIEDALPLPDRAHELPLVLYDRSLDSTGQLVYPVSGIADAPWVPECYGNAILCNGRLFPYVEVEPRPYRLRVLNAANTRFFNLKLTRGLRFSQIGSDQGLLSAPVGMAALQLFPAERADVIVDFSAQAGQEVLLNHQSDPVLQFRVGRKSVPRMRALPSSLRPITRMSEHEAVRERVLSLGEDGDASGKSTRMLLGGHAWDAPITETPELDSVEIWSLVNFTGDAHPIHLHLVRFQVLDRRPFDVFAYNADRSLRYTGQALLPEAAEQGWKDTVRADGGMVTRIIVRFEGYAGRYVWHCHLLEHEDNEMMRPYAVLAKSAS